MFIFIHSWLAWIDLNKDIDINWFLNFWSILKSGECLTKDIGIWIVEYHTVLQAPQPKLKRRNLNFSQGYNIEVCSDIDADSNL